MERDNWECCCCGAKDKTLNVHHIEYHGDLWDTPSEFLQTLCENCHSSLGPHKAGGVEWGEGGVFMSSHCPVCGSTKLRDRGTFDKCNDCGHRIEPDRWV